jgi:trimeric autotransporter adhesin
LLAELSVGPHRAGAGAGLLSLPAAAQAPVSAALGRDQAAYRIRGLVARNPAQRLAAQFGRSGVAVTAGSARFAIALKAFGRGGVLRALAAVSPVARADRVSYARGPVREWWANGPLGLEQGFDIARRPAGSGVLTLSLAVSGSARLDHGTVLLPGGLRYAGLRATDARGLSLHAWLQARDGRILVRVNDRGARYPVRIDPFVEQAELTPSDGVGADGDADQFGYSVATSGNTVVVGAPYHEANSEPYSGAVYVFHMLAAGWANATQTAELTDSTLGGNEELGFSVAISSDGDTIVAGAPAGSQAPPQEHSNPGDTQGTIDVFTTTGGWTSTSTPNARLTVAGAPATESPGGGELGWSVGISGTTIVAGAPYDGSAGFYPGLAYVFNEQGGAWSGPQTQAAVLTASPLSTTGSGVDQFGWSVGISGNTIVVGAPAWAGASKQEQGAAYVFTGPWSGTQTDTAELLASDPTSSAQLGTSVAVSGNTVVAGAVNHQVGSNPTQGAVYVWVMPTTGPWIDANDTAELTVANGEPDDEFGYSVGISGNTIVAGAIQHTVGTNHDQGAVYVYTQPPAGGWATTSADTAELTASDGDGSDNLGDSVAVSGTTIVAGAARHDAESPTADFGAAYVFGPESSVPPPPPPPVVVPPTTKVSGGHAEITVALSCPAGGATCAPVSLKATVKEHLKGRKITAISAGAKHKKVRTTTKQVVVASARVTLSAGRNETLTLKLNSTGRALLSKFGKLRAIVTISSGGKTIKTVTVTVLKAKKPKKK